MIVRDEGTYAGVRAMTYLGLEEVKRNGIAFWVRGHHQVLSSNHYASCVGLVLHGDLAGYGAVAHFWNPSGLDDARTIVDRYLQWLFDETGGYCGDEVEAVVFGGTALETSTGAELTRPRMNAIRQYLETRWEMRIVVADYGSFKVSLDLSAQGPIEKLVTLDRGTLASKPHESSLSPRSKTVEPTTGTRKRSPSAGQ